MLSVDGADWSQYHPVKANNLSGLTRA
jgi:hypothetical protein